MYYTIDDYVSEAKSFEAQSRKLYERVKDLLEDPVPFDKIDEDSVFTLKCNGTEIQIKTDYQAYYAYPEIRVCPEDEAEDTVTFSDAQYDCEIDDDDPEPGSVGSRSLKQLCDDLVEEGEYEIPWEVDNVRYAHGSWILWRLVRRALRLVEELTDEYEESLEGEEDEAEAC
jgi:hypothetical protein